VQLDDLYGLPLDRFVPERGALAKALRADGHRDEAAAVAKLRKPSAAAWAVNRLVRGEGSAVAELFDAGDALRDAQTALLEGRGDGRALREAGEREREAVDVLVGLVEGESPATLDRVAETLHAAALDEGAREAVRDGCLERELRHAGLGLGEAAAVFAAAPSEPAAKPKAKPVARKDAAAERKTAKERAAAAAAAEAERDAERKRARAAVAKAAKAVERLGHAVRAAEERRERAAAALDEADKALEAARSSAAEASAEHERARAELDRSLRPSSSAPRASRSS
jgi:hypothetical protein